MFTVGAIVLAINIARLAERGNDHDRPGYDSMEPHPLWLLLLQFKTDSVCPLRSDRYAWNYCGSDQVLGANHNGRFRHTRFGRR